MPTGGRKDRGAGARGRAYGLGRMPLLALAALAVGFGYMFRRGLRPGHFSELLEYNGTQNALASPSKWDSIRGESPPVYEEEYSSRVPSSDQGMDQEAVFPVAAQTPEQNTYGDDALDGHEDGIRPYEPLDSYQELIAPVGLASPPDVPTAQERPARSSIRPLLIEILQTVLLTLVIFAGVRSVVQNFKVDGASMEPTLHTGQYLLINKVAYAKIEGAPLDVAKSVGLVGKDAIDYYPFGGPQHGDIAVFEYPAGPDRDFIKRVIGLPGDTVQVDRGRVYVNGVMLSEDYIRAIPTYSLPPQKVPQDNFFVLGDNRPNSSDSHIWGYVPADNMIGKAWVSYWPPSDWGVVVGKEGFATTQ